MPCDVMTGSMRSTVVYRGFIGHHCLNSMSLHGSDKYIGSNQVDLIPNQKGKLTKPQREKESREDCFCDGEHCYREFPVSESLCLELTVTFFLVIVLIGVCFLGGAKCVLCVWLEGVRKFCKFIVRFTYGMGLMTKM